MNTEAESLKHTGTAEYKKGDMEAAKNCFTRALQLDPENMEYHLSRAATAMALRDYELCVDDCRRVVEIGLANDPDQITDEYLAKAYARMGTAYFAQHKYNLASRCCKSAYQTLPSPELKQIYDQIESINVKVAGTRLQAEKAMAKEKEKEKSKDKKKRNVDPSASADAANYCTEAKEAYKDGDYSRAATLYTMAISCDPVNTRSVTYINRAACHQKSKQFELALVDAEKAIELDPTVSQGYFRKGCALEGLKRKEEAFAAYELGLKHDPDHAMLNKRYQILKTQLHK